MGVRRIIPYLQSDDFAAVEAFYGGLLGLESAGMGTAGSGDFVGFSAAENPSAQIAVSAPGVEDPMPHMGIDLGDPDAVDAAHAEAVRRGLEVVYPLTDEPWGIRRFFVRDPTGVVVSVLAHR